MKTLYALAICFTFLVEVHSQTIGLGTSNPDNSAIVEISSQNKGLLIPRLTEVQRLLIQTPGQGLIVYQTNNDTGFYYYRGAQWRNLANEFKNDQGSIIVYTREVNSVQEIWKANLDGTNNSKININLPSNISFNVTDGGSVKITPDNKRVIFLASDTSTDQHCLYSCYLDGSSLTRVLDVPTGTYIDLGCVN